MNSIKTINGTIDGVVNFETYGDGAVKSCILKAYNLIETNFGPVVPQYNVVGYGERQKKYRSSIAFFPKGQIKSVALENQTPIQTPIGTYPAELLTFYEDGSINRIFPLNGKIDGFWSEENEGEKAEKYSFEFSFGHFDAKIIGLHFYPSGALKSITLWPGEQITLRLYNKNITVRIGFSLYENGSLKSIEPATPTKINTIIGEILAYDIDALGIHADENSVNFDLKGELVSLKSIHSGINIIDKNGIITNIEPQEIESTIDEVETTILPIKIVFNKKHITISDEQTWTFDKSSHKFSIYKRQIKQESACSNCSSCSSCH